jgi:hypothetical protein
MSIKVAADDDIERIARSIFEAERQPDEFWDAAQPRGSTRRTPLILKERDRDEYRRRARSVLAGADI